MGMPGTLPTLNEKVVEYAIKMGHALNCGINRICKQDRKNYFYPDLPKSYQISQADIPVCHDGYLDVIVNGEVKRIGIERIHIEEDAGKLLHSDKFDGSLVDFNRCGVPLIEIVSRPDMRGSEEAKAYLETIKSILKYIDISDCKLQEGSIRCDVNVSVHKPGEPFGTRCEMKNVNSFSAVVRGIDYEANRQIEVLEAGGKITQETRRWDDAKGESIPMRSKEDAQDYKYFPEPDLPPIEISDEYIENVKNTLPELPEAKKARYMSQFGLPEYDTGIITSDVNLVKLFEHTVEICNSPKDAANWIMGELMKMLNDTGTLSENMSFNPDSLGKLINMIKAGKINRGTAKSVFEKIFTEDVDPEKYVEENNLGLVTDLSAIRPVIEQVIADNEKSVSEYKAGKTQAMGYIMGQAMRALKGKAPAQEVQKILKEILG